MKTKRQKHSAAFKAKVALEALQEREPITDIARKHGIHPQMITRWKKELMERATQVFEHPASAPAEEENTDKLYMKIGQLEVERDFLKKNLQKLGL